MDETIIRKRAERIPDRGEVEMIPGIEPVTNEIITYVKEKPEEEAESEIISETMDPEAKVPKRRRDLSA